MRFTAGVIVGIIIGRPVLSTLDKMFGPVVYHLADKSLGCLAWGFESAARHIDERIENYNQGDEK
jgi:hypothetical protein